MILINVIYDRPSSAAAASTNLYVLAKRINNVSTTPPRPTVEMVAMADTHPSYSLYLDGHQVRLE